MRAKKIKFWLLNLTTSHRLSTSYFWGIFSLLVPQSRQSAKLFLQSSEWGLPHPLTRKQVCPPPFGSGGGGAHSLGDEGVEEYKFRRGNIHCGTLLYIYTCTLSQRGNSRTYTYVEVSGHNRESSQTWGFYLRFLPFYKMLFSKLEFSSLIDCFVWISETIRVLWLSVSSFCLVYTYK